MTGSTPQAARRREGQGDYVVMKNDCASEPLRGENGGKRDGRAFESSVCCFNSAHTGNSIFPRVGGCYFSQWPYASRSEVLQQPYIIVDFERGRCFVPFLSSIQSWQVLLQESFPKVVRNFLDFFPGIERQRFICFFEKQWVVCLRIGGVEGSGLV